jgi:hypothetical protein
MTTMSPEPESGLEESRDAVTLNRTMRVRNRLGEESIIRVEDWDPALYHPWSEPTSESQSDTPSEGQELSAPDRKGRGPRIGRPREAP